MVLCDSFQGSGSTKENGRAFEANHYNDANNPSKRRRRNQKQAQAAGIRDCYEEATTSTPKIRHDWFFEIPSISKHKHDPRYHLGPAPELLAELQSLDAQLSQVKHQFRPASERCASVVGRSNAFRTTSSYEFELARRASNPYEPLTLTKPGGLNHGLFINRSAIKLANMDAALKFKLTTPSATTTNSSGETTFYFADLCAAPGGFSEYLLRRSCHSITESNSAVACRGYGMSLAGDNHQGHGTEWKLIAGPLLMAKGKPGVSYQICWGEDGTGDLLQWKNVQCLQRKIAVAQSALKPSVALVCADGGVDAQRNLEHQESETQKLVVCQVAAALSMLAPNGRFVLKLLACQSTPILKRALQELYDCFETLQVMKPISSRPASAERYLVCSGYRPTPNVELGPAWIERVMKVDTLVAPELASFLGQVDRDMMQLNLRACQAILSKMHEKTKRLETPLPTAMTPSIMGNGDDMEEDEEDEAWITQGYQNYHSEPQNKGKRIKKVNVNAYKRAWKLF